MIATGRGNKPQFEAISISNPHFRDLITDPVYLLAFGFGSGLARKAPGTFGSVAAIPPYLLMSHLPLWAYAAVVASAFALGVFICDQAAKRLRIKDPAGIVWDEFVGLWIALFMLPQGWWYLVLGFLLFRFFDILKPWPVNYVDRNVTGGLGIMVDDVAAGLYALLVVQLIAAVAAAL